MANVNEIKKIFNGTIICGTHSFSGTSATVEVPCKSNKILSASFSAVGSPTVDPGLHLNETVSGRGVSPNTLNKVTVKRIDTSDSGLTFSYTFICG